MRRPMTIVLLVVAVALIGSRGDGASRAAQAPIDHIVVLFLENRSFDHLFGTYPGADGLAAYHGRQVDKNGLAYTTLPPPLGRDANPDTRFPADLANAPFQMLKFIGPFDPTNNPIHRFYHMQRQYMAGADARPLPSSGDSRKSSCCWIGISRGSTADPFPITST